MSVANMTLPQLRRGLETTSYEMWGGYSKYGIEVVPFLGRESWCLELQEEIGRREWREEYPEHAKLDAIPPEQYNAIGGFIEWQMDRWRLPWGAEELLFEYFGIDQEAFAKEADEMYEELRQGG